MEIWKDIKGYEGLYQVSNMGRIKSLNYRRTGKEGIMTPSKNNDGYLIICLYKNKKTKTFLVHRLVAKHFLPNNNNLPEVNHIIDDFEHRSDNRVENLEWCTREYNNNYGNRTKKHSENIKRYKNPKAKKVKCITTNEIFNCMKDAEEKYNVAYQSISSCCKGKLKSAGKHPITKEKLVWQYVE